MTLITNFPADIAAAGWVLADDKKAINKTFKFASFADAMAFMLRVSYAAEAADHHPEWRNVYNRVEVRLTSHDAGGLTHKDVKLAQVMELCAGAPDIAKR